MTATLLAPAAWAQASSSSSGATLSQDSTSTPHPRVAEPEAGGSAITLETSESLFDLAVALNTCGYDAGLDTSAPVRLTIRKEIDEALASSAPARDHRDALCTFVHEHTLSSPRLNLAQYISLALYLNPPPELTPSVDITELPPDSTQVVEILPRLRAFAEDIHLHAIWVKHHPDYEALTALIHDPLTKMVLDTNIYLRLPVSSYDGRRFLVLIEPLLSPDTTNARIYGTDYIVVTSPAGNPPGHVHMDDIRHTYLHYEVEPLIYARASAMDRLLPLLKPVREAPIEFTYKSDIVSLITECLIKAIEAQTMDTGLVRPAKPASFQNRGDMDQYDNAITAWQHKSEEIRRKAVNLDMRQGWTLTGYFYDKIGAMEHESISLKEDIGEMVYGMDIGREEHTDSQIVFLPEQSRDVVTRSPRQLTGLDLAEMKLLKGDPTTAAGIAEKTLANPTSTPGAKGQAYYIRARADLLASQPGAAITDFEQTLKTSTDPRTLAWSHIYLGRLYDVVPDRQKAMAEYHAALTVRDSRPDTKAAAEKGLKEAFTQPNAPHPAVQEDDNAPLDPSGKAEKDAYRPPS